MKKKFCGRCGRPLDEDTGKCFYCVGKVKPKKEKSASGKSGGKKKIIMIAGIVVLVLILLFVFISVFMSRPNEELKSSVATAWESARSAEDPAYLARFDELSSYELIKVKKDGDRYIIDATVTAPDLASRLSQIDYAQWPQSNDTNLIDTFLCEQIDESEMTETEVVFYAYKVDGEYEIYFSDEFVDAMYGNIYSYSQTVLVDLLQEQEG